MQATSTGFGLYIFILIIKRAHGISQSTCLEPDSRHILCKQYQINSEMASNDSDLLRKGLTSEYFLASFLEKDPSGYRLAQVVQDKTGRPDTSKTYDVLERLTDSRYLVEKNEKYYPNLERLVDTIDSSSLREWQEHFDLDEKETFVKMLQNREFFKIVSDEILQQIHGQQNRVHSIDALEIIANKIGLLTAAIILYRSFAPSTIQESSGDQQSTEKDLRKINVDHDDFKTAWKEQVIPMLEEFAFDRKLASNSKKMQKELTKEYNLRRKNAKKPEKDSVPKPPNMQMLSGAITIFLKSLPSLRLFFAVPENTLWKLCKLWEGYDALEYVIKIIRGFANQNKNYSG